MAKRKRPHPGVSHRLAATADALGRPGSGRGGLLVFFFLL